MRSLSLSLSLLRGGCRENKKPTLDVGGNSTSLINSFHMHAGPENIRRLWSAWLSTHQTSDWCEHAVCWVGCWVEFCCTLGCVLGCVLGWMRVAKSFLTPKVARISSRCPCMENN